MNLKKGFAKVMPETLDDLWHLYNIIYNGDEVYAQTSREIKLDEKYARPKHGERVSVFLGVKVENIVWDKLLGRLRIHGKICESPEIVPTGAHHTLNVNLNTPITIVKKEWTKNQIERLERASQASEKPIIMIAIDDEGYAIVTTTQYNIEVKTEENFKLPGKREAEKRAEATKKYFKKALESLRQIWMLTRSPIAIIGVGFVKNDFAKFLETEDAEIARHVADVKSVNNSGAAGIYEALRSGVLQKALSQQRIVEEVKVVEEILKRLGKGERTVAYGISEVEEAIALGAVERLVLADAKLREASNEERLHIEELMKNVEQKGGSMFVISTEHEAGTQLLALGGIAALLRFSLQA